MSRIPLFRPEPRDKEYPDRGSLRSQGGQHQRNEPDFRPCLLRHVAVPVDEFQSLSVLPHALTDAGFEILKISGGGGAGAVFLLCREGDTEVALHLWGWEGK